MTWVAYLYDTVSGQLAQEIDIPSFTWSMTVSDSSFSTTKDKGVGDDEVSGLELPWTQIPGDDPAARAAALQPYKRGLVLCWKSVLDDTASMGTPILAGALGVRTSSWHDVSVPYVSMMGLLNDRYLVHEDAFGKDAGHTSKRSFRWENLSWRALACEVIRQCTSVKPGGGLPIDLPYLNETGTHSLPSDGSSEDKNAPKQKSKKRVNTADGYVETSVDGDTTTITEQHVTKKTKQVTETKPYTYNTRKGKVTKQHTTVKTLTTAQTTVVKKTVTKNYKDYSERTVTTTTTVYSFDGNGNQTGSTTSTDGPHKTMLPRQTVVEYKDFNVSNHRAADILKNIANADGGPDMQFRPYLSDSQHVRFRFLAGSDGDIYLNQDKRLSLSCSPYGGTLENIKIDRAAPFMRVYATGAGSDSGTMCCQSEDLALVNREDPYPLRETTVSSTDSKTYELLASAANGMLNANRLPLMQLSGEIDVNDCDATGLPLHPLGSFWPGEMFDIAIDGFPDLPDGVYPMRLMRMSGDETGKVTLKFDPVGDPTA
jgi:hypothetical protein|nr:MAG TPA: ReqiPepy6 protein [Caudoviricetes sp.]